MSLLYLLISFIAGTLLSLQAGVNGQLRTHSGAIFATCASFLIGTLCLLTILAAACLMKTESFPSGAALRETKWWMWMGGLMGVFFIMASVVIPPKIGFATYYAILVAGQLLCAIVIDRFGLFGSIARAITPARICGVALIVVGAVLIRKL